MTRTIEPLSLDEFVGLVKPKNGLLVYRSTGWDGNKIGNSFSRWGIVERNARYLLAKLGIPTVTLDVKNIDNYVSPYQADIEDIQTKLNEQPFAYSSREYFEDILKNVLKNVKEAKEQDERLVKSMIEEGTGLWLSGCLCCATQGNEFAEMARRFEKGRLGILVPRDHAYLNLDELYEAMGNGIGYLNHFTFVAPEIKEK